MIEAMFSDLLRNHGHGATDCKIQTRCFALTLAHFVGLASGRRVLFGGSSAGGRGAMTQLDMVAKELDQ